MRGFQTIALLILSNSFMTLAWYGHLKFSEMKWFNQLGLFSIFRINHLMGFICLVLAVYFIFKN
jgi:hypothetical protein